MTVGQVLLSLSLQFIDLEFFTSALSSLSIWSSREDLWFKILFLGEAEAVLVDVVAAVVFMSVDVEMTLSNRAALLGEAIAFNCFPSGSLRSSKEGNHMKNKSTTFQVGAAAQDMQLPSLRSNSFCSPVPFPGKITYGEPHSTQLWPPLMASILLKSDLLRPDWICSLLLSGPVALTPSEETRGPSNCSSTETIASFSISAKSSIMDMSEAAIVLFVGDPLCFPCLQCSNSEIKAEAQDSAELTLSSLPISDIEARDISCGVSTLFVLSKASLRILFSSSTTHNCSARKLILFLGESAEFSTAESTITPTGRPSKLLLLMSTESLPRISTSLFILAKEAGPGNRLRTRTRSL
uniref:Uncharacterized protein n=1 Tax=Salix viminalis TaxID=40686 RepID=A0A6N2M7M1_SALVM